MPRARCLALVGPGLDGRLAAEFARRAGVDVIVATFVSPFTLQHTDIERWASEQAFAFVSLFSDDNYLQRMRHPRFGYTREAAPCLDCKVLMLAAAREELIKQDAQFLITGDVIGQRLPGQSKRDLALVDFHAAAEGLVVRPLSGRLLPATNWLPPDKLLSLQGRSRKGQTKLARSFGWTDLPAVTSGCLLADAHYAHRLRRFEELPADFTAADYELIRHGRLSLTSPNCLLILGRNASENAELAAWYDRHGRDERYVLLAPDNFAGPTAIVRQTSPHDLSRFFPLIWRSSKSLRSHSDFVRMLVRRHAGDEIHSISIAELSSAAEKAQ